MGEGYLGTDGQPDHPDDYFEFDMVMFGGIDPMPICGGDEIVEETDSWVVRRNGAGAVLKRWKHRSGAPEHLSFDMTSRTWKY